VGAWARGRGDWGRTIEPRCDVRSRHPNVDSRRVLAEWQRRGAFCWVMWAAVHNPKGRQCVCRLTLFQQEGGWGAAADNFWKPGRPARLRPSVSDKHPLWPASWLPRRAQTKRTGSAVGNSPLLQAASNGQCARPTRVHVAGAFSAARQSVVGSCALRVADGCGEGGGLVADRKLASLHGQFDCIALNTQCPCLLGQYTV
jgi:hypothetical protein